MAETTFRAPREWTRVHPVSPLLGGWAVLGVLLAYFIHQRLPDLIAGTSFDSAFEFADRFPLMWILVAAVLGFAITMLVSIWQWRRTEYRIGDDAVYLRQGIITQQQRQARLDRLQAVDVVQPLLARIFGFAAINVQVAGGAKSGVELKFLRLGDAEALRNEILALAAGVTVSGDDATVQEAPAGSPRLRDLGGHLTDRAQALNNPEAVLLGTETARTAVAAAEERTVYTVPVGRLLLSTVLSGPTMVLVLIALAAIPAVLLFEFDLLGTLLAALGGSLFATVGALFGLLGFFWTRINGGFHFSAGLSSDGLRLRHGLTETRRQTVPPGRVQAIRLHQPWFWRGKDWWRISINVAGYGEDQESVSILHPVATRQEALTAVWLILPDLGDPDPAGTLGLAMSGQGDQGGFLTSPPAARRLDPLQWRFRGVRATERALLIRRGRWERELYVVPHERTQSIGLTQGPIERSLGLADVAIHSTQGPVKPVAIHLAVDDAMALLDAQAARAREGRRRQTPEQWMEAVGL